MEEKRKPNGWWRKFKSLPREKKFLIIFAIFCVFAPLCMVRNPTEIASHVLPLWWQPMGLVGLFGVVGYWLYTGMPILKTFLACFFATSFGIILFYSGTAGIMYFLAKWKWFSKIKSKVLKEGEGNNQGNKKGGWETRLAGWLSRKSVWLILLCLFLPFPYTDQAAAVAMKLKNVRYGLWYLLAANAVQSFIIVFSVYFGINRIF